MQSLLAYWFHVRFGVGPEALGALFFGTNLLSALSFLAAARIAERVGLLNTMVFTHLPSNLLLLGVPFMPTFGSARGAAAGAAPAVADGRAHAAGLHGRARRAGGARGRRGPHRERARARPVGGPGGRRRRHGRGRRTGAVPARGRAQDRVRPLPLLPLPLGAPRQAGARPGRAARWRRRRVRALRPRHGTCPAATSPLRSPGTSGAAPDGTAASGRASPCRRTGSRPASAPTPTAAPRGSATRRATSSATSRASTGRRSSSRRPGRGSTCASSSRGR